MEGLEQIGFDVGWDHADYGVPVPEELMNGTLADGFQAGMLRRGRARPKEADRYVRKWLQLRRNAWRRGRIFSPNVTPAYIRSIDVEYCPITRRRLTHSTGLDTDWSIDRLENNAGYAVGNLVVMSTRANKAKDSLTFQEIFEMTHISDFSNELVRLANICKFDGLTSSESIRLYVLMSLHKIDHNFFPPLVAPPVGMPINGVYLAMANLAFMSVAAVFRSDVKARLKSMAGSIVSPLNKTIRRIMMVSRPRLTPKVQEYYRTRNIGQMYTEIVWAAEDAWSDHVALESFLKWYKGENPVQVQAVVYKLCSTQIGRQGSWFTDQTIGVEQFAEQIGMATRGYVEA